MNFKVSRITWIGILTLFGFPLLGLGLFWLFAEGWQSFLDSFKTKSSLEWELVIGFSSGIMAGVFAWLIIASNWMRSILLKYGDMVKNLNLSLFQIILLSICAGAGEEIFFRGALQPYLGVWITAVFFVAIHGYLNFKDVKIFVYGLFMTLVIASFGWMTNHYGLLSAILAHTMVDVVLFYKLTNTKLLRKNIEVGSLDIWAEFEEE